MRTLHIPRGALDGGWVHRWAVSRWEDVRELLELLLVPEEKQKIEIFHVGRDADKPAAILRCDAEVDDGGTHPPVEVFFMIILTPAPLAPPLQLLSDTHLGFGTVRKKEPKLTLEDLPTIEYVPLLLALAEAYNADYLTKEMTGTFDDPRARQIDDVLDAEIHSALKRAGRENTRFMLGLAARQPDTVRALQAARKFGYSDEQVCGWIELRSRKPEFSKVLVDALVGDLK